jgi:hypothetical protein
MNPELGGFPSARRSLGDLIFSTHISNVRNAGLGSRRRLPGKTGRTLMQAISRHHRAALHHEQAASHHEEMAKPHAVGEREKSAYHAHVVGMHHQLLTITRFKLPRLIFRLQLGFI